jgi:hypothetical protein
MENNIELTGKVAKFPKNTKAVKALKFLESVKVNPNKLCPDLQLQYTTTYWD